MQCGIPNHYPKFSKLHQFAYIIEPHHQEKGRCDQIQLKNIWGISLTLLDMPNPHPEQTVHTRPLGSTLQVGPIIQ